MVNVLTKGDTANGKDTWCVYKFIEIFLFGSMIGQSPNLLIYRDERITTLENIYVFITLKLFYTAS